MFIVPLTAVDLSFTFVSGNNGLHWIEWYFCPSIILRVDTSILAQPTLAPWNLGAYLGGLLHQMNQPESNWIKVNHYAHFVHHQIPITINSAKAAVAASVVPASGSAENNTTAQL